MKGILLIVSGPSGAGKGTVVQHLVQQKGYALSVSATTRSPRPGEAEGVHYFFKTPEEFLALRRENQLLEWAEFCGNFYGTPRKYVEQKLCQGENVILEIEVQGALQVKAQMPEAVLIFLLPPSRNELRTRLTGRGTEDAETVERRIARAAEELEFFLQYDYVVVNHTVEQAVAEVETIVSAERLKVSRNLELGKLFEKACGSR